MTTYLHRIAAALALAAATASAGAQTPTAATANRGEKILMAYCMAGQGCTGQLTDWNVEDLQLLLPGTDAMNGAKDPILVFPRNKAGEWTYYVDTRRQLQELHREFGGQGQPQIVLFPPELPGEIQPRDGRWTVAAQGDPVVKDCPRGVGEALAGRTAMMRSGPVAFKRPFHGRQLIDNPAIHWLKTAPNRYAGALVTTGSQAMTFRYDVAVVGPERMDGQSRVLVNIPGLKTCTITTSFRYQRTGN